MDFPNNCWYIVVLGKTSDNNDHTGKPSLQQLAPHDYEVPHNYRAPCDIEYYTTAQLVIRHEQELSATLTEQHNAILQKIKDNHTELLCLGERDAFCRGFSLAVKLITEAMSDKT